MIFYDQKSYIFIYAKSEASQFLYPCDPSKNRDENMFIQKRWKKNIPRFNHLRPLGRDPRAPRAPVLGCGTYRLALPSLERMDPGHRRFYRPSDGWGHHLVASKC